MSHPSSNPSIDLSLTGGRLLLTRLSWGLGIVLCWGVYVSRLPGQWQGYVAWYSLPVWQAVLSQLRLAPQWIAAYILALQLATVMTSTIMAGLLGWRKPQDRLVLFSSFILVIFAVAFGTEALWGTYGENWPGDLIYTLAHVLILLFLSTFPDGRFLPRWTIILQALWSGWLVVGFFFPAISFFALKFPLPAIVQAIVYGLGMMAQLYRYRQVSTPLQKQQTRWVLLGVALIFFGFLLRRASIVIFGNPSQPDVFNLLDDIFFYYPIFSLPRILISVFLAIAILRYRLWDIDTLINRSLVYGSLTTAVIVLYFLSVTLLQYTFRAMTGQASDLALVLSTALIAIVFQPLRHYLQNAIDRLFYREKIDFRQAFQAFARDLRHYIDLPELLHVLVYRLTDLFHSTYGAVYLADGLDGTLRLAEAHGLPHRLPVLSVDAEQLEHLQLGTTLSRPGESIFSLLVPLITWRADRRELVGVLALGPKRSEADYGHEDLAQLTMLVDEAGTAISLAQAVSEKQKAIQERQIAQAQQLELEKHNRRQAANNETILNNIADGVLVLDLQGNFLTCNPALFSMIPEEALRAIITKPLEKTIRWRHKVFTVTTAPVPEVGTVAVFRDETRRHEMERAKDAMLATASHEFRTPLTVTMNYLELLQLLIKMDRVDTVEFSEHLARALENSKRLEHLVTNILDRAQIQAGMLELKNRPFDLPALLEKTHQLLDVLIRQKNLAFELNIAPGVPTEIIGDHERLQQVMMNLIGNAIKFTEQGGIRVAVANDGPGRLSIEVADTGPGIPPEQMPDIFEPFRRGSNYARREHQGAGLGLSIAREIVLRMGGEISVSSEPGAGSVFTISIPVDGTNAGNDPPDGVLDF